MVGDKMKESPCQQWKLDINDMESKETMEQSRAKVEKD